MEAANLLMEAAPSEGVTNANYWSRKGEALLWPILFAAAIGDTHHGRCGALARAARRQPTRPANRAPRRDHEAQTVSAAGEIRAILHRRDGSNDPTERWRSRRSTRWRSSTGSGISTPAPDRDIYSTSQTLVQPWEDPNVSFASSTDAGDRWPTCGVCCPGNNTLYVVQPLKSTQRFSVVFGGLLGALLKDQAYEVAKRYRPAAAGSARA